MLLAILVVVLLVVVIITLVLMTVGIIVLAVAALLLRVARHVAKKGGLRTVDDDRMSADDSTSRKRDYGRSNAKLQARGDSETVGEAACLPGSTYLYNWTITGNNNLSSECQRPKTQ